MNNSIWQDIKCSGCGNGFASLREFEEAHVQHDHECPSWLGRHNECECSEYAHPQCCMDCNGTAGIVIAKAFEGHSTDEIIGDLDNAIGVLLRTKKFASLHEELCQDPLCEVHKDFERTIIEHTRKSYTLCMALEQRGVDVAKAVKERIRSRGREN